MSPKKHAKTLISEVTCNCTHVTCMYTRISKIALKRVTIFLPGGLDLTKSATAE